MKQPTSYPVGESHVLPVRTLTVTSLLLETVPAGCYGLSFCVSPSPNSHVEMLTPNMMGPGSGACGM